MYYETRLSTKYPSYPHGNSFLNIVIADTRFTFHDKEEDCQLTNVSYDTDHNAIRFHISTDNNDRLTLDCNTNYRYNFRKTALENPIA